HMSRYYVMSADFFAFSSARPRRALHSFLHDALPILGARAAALQRLVLGADHAGHRVADERAELREQAPDFGGHLPDVARANLERDRKSTRLNSSHVSISYAVFCSKKKSHQC